ncbi:MAG: hypothetical protein HC836_35875 [Richelia sp. RM2_1_2]|nr:hypothetical protein [Richelia sp. RM2_1_2]
MDIKRTIQLGEKKFLEAVNVDNYQNIELKNDKKELIEYDIKNLLDVSSVFNDERQATNIYRVYGRIEYLSLLNGIKPNYEQLIDFFTPVPSGASRNITNSFDFYLLKPSSGYTSLSGDSKYVKQYEVLSKLSDFDLYQAGYFVNVYNEKQYLFNFKRDYDIGGYLDGLHFPITELALYAAYKVNNGETMEYRTYDSGSTETGFTQSPYVYTPLNVGDTVYGNLIRYNEEEYSKETINEQTYYVSCPYIDGVPKELVFKYNPITEITVSVLDDTLQIVNVSGTAYQDIQTIPYYAIPYGDGNFIWRDILAKGYFDPITGVGVNFPFVNQRQYVFNNFLLSVVPDLDDANTASVFSQIKYGPNKQLSKSPTDLDNMGKIC